MKSVMRNLPSFVKLSIYKIRGAKIGKNVYLGKKSILAGRKMRIGDNARIMKDCSLVFDELDIGSNVCIGKGTDIRAAKLSIGDNSVIHEGCNMLVADGVVIGRNSVIRKGMNMCCTRADIGEFLYACNNITIGDGGEKEPTAKLRIGNHCYLGSDSIINVNQPMTIGNDCAIGPKAMLYTHGEWLPALEGYTVSFAPVKIGDDSVIGGGSIVLSGVNIGSGTMVAMGAVVNRDIEPNSLAAGVPAVIKKKYERNIPLEQKDRIVRAVLERYIPVLAHKEFDVAMPKETKKCVVIDVGADARIIYSAKYSDAKNTGNKQRTIHIFIESGAPPAEKPGTTYFDLGRMKICGESDDLSEDVRDFFRRNAIKIYTDTRFRQMVPPKFRRLMEA